MSQTYVISSACVAERSGIYKSGLIRKHRGATGDVIPFGAMLVTILATARPNAESIAHRSARLAMLSMQPYCSKNNWPRLSNPLPLTLRALTAHRGARYARLI